MTTQVVMKTVMIDKKRRLKAIMENTLYGLSVHAGMMIQQLKVRGKVSDDVIDRLHVGWTAYLKAKEEYFQEEHREGGYLRNRQYVRYASTC